MACCQVSRPPHGCEEAEGCVTDAKPRPEFAREFGAVALDREDRERTQANTKDDDAMVSFDAPLSPGAKTALRVAKL